MQWQTNVPTRGPILIPAQMQERVLDRWDDMIFPLLVR